MLDAEVRQVEIFLVHDGRDPRIDFDHVLADELDVEEVVEPQLSDDSCRDLQQRRITQRFEVHREPGSHRLPRLRVAEQHLSRARNAVDGALSSLGQLHHEQIGPTFLGEHLEHVLEA